MTKLMTPRPGVKSGNIRGFRYTETISNGSDGQSVVLPTFTPWKNITIQIIAGAGAGKAQYTLSDEDSIRLGTAVWVDWDKGSGSGTVADVLISAVTGLRGVSSSGEIVVDIVI